MPVCREIESAGQRGILVHTGQHYDYQMSQVFFEELNIPIPDFNLEVGSGNHGVQTGKMLAGIEEILITVQPDWVLVFGDTNSTLAGALAASKLHIKVAHVEAGLRSYNRMMPEEINRLITDHISDKLFCPSQVSVDNLKAEGIKQGVHIVGDVMFDALKYGIAILDQRPDILKTIGVTPKKYYLATIHRAENTDNQSRLLEILSALKQLDDPVLFLAHPRTRKVLVEMNYQIPTNSNLRLLEPVSYLDMLKIQQSAKVILTDSGGIQKEAYWLGVPCITLRDETEWVETIQSGWNILAGARNRAILEGVHVVNNLELPRPHIYGDGKSAQLIVDILKNY
jgi:UDP-N-acetylglucosamine 2-epimerase